MAVLVSPLLDIALVLLVQAEAAHTLRHQVGRRSGRAAYIGRPWPPSPAAGPTT
eukprot:gene18402-13232_t